jgi:hypothetical protein
MPRTANVTLVVKGWTGWTREQPPSKSAQLAVQPGQKLTPALAGIESSHYEITIEFVGFNHILVTYSGVVLENSDGTINLRAPQQGRCIIHLQHSLRLATATLDGGTTLALSLDSII